MDFSQLVTQAGVAVAFAIVCSYILWKHVVNENLKKDNRMDQQDVRIQDLHNKIEGVLTTTIKESTAAITKFNQLAESHANVLPRLYSHMAQIAKKLQLEEIKVYDNHDTNL